MLAPICHGTIINRGGIQYRVLGSFTAGPGVDIGALTSLAVKAYSEKSIDGVWLLMFLNPTDAESIAIEGGESPDELHLTIGALDPATTRGKQDLINSIVAHAAAQLPSVKGKIGGIGQFASDGKVPVVALFDSSELNAWRDALLGTLKSVGVELLSDHGYTPHVTLMYADGALDQLPPVDGREIELGTLSLVWEGDRRDFQLTGQDVKAIYLTADGPDIEADSWEEAEGRAGGHEVIGKLVAQWEIKGGPGSGHHDHIGRPGERGGSLPGNARVPKDWFTTGPGAKIFDDSVPEEFKQQCIRTLTDPDVKVKYIQDLNRISVGDPPPDDGWTDEHGGVTLAYYQHDEGLICFNPEVVEKGSYTFRDSYYQNARRRSARQVFAHEFGHHVFYEMYVEMPKGEAKTQKYNKANAGRNMIFADFVEKGILELEVGVDAAGNPTKTFYPLRPDAYAEGLADLGLRRYSFSKPTEFIADVWMVNHIGTSKQKQTLADAMGLDTLEELF